MNDLQPPVHDYDAYAAACGGPPAPKPTHSALEIVLMSLCGVIGFGALMIALFCGFAVVSSLVGSDPGNDPHGFGIIFGFVFGVPSGVLAAVILPAAFPRGMRATAFTVSMAILGLVTVVVVSLIAVS